MSFCSRDRSHRSCLGDGGGGMALEGTLTCLVVEWCQVLQVSAYGAGSASGS